MSVMTSLEVPWLRQMAAASAFVPRPRGFGAALLGLSAHAVRYDSEALIRAVRQERELLEPDLALVSADPTLLAEDCGAEVIDIAPYRWRAVTPAPYQDAAGGEAEPPPLAGSGVLATAVRAANALGVGASGAIMLPTPLTLAAQLRPSPPPTPRLEALWADFVDACALTVTDAAKLVLTEGGCEVVLYERLAAPVADYDDVLRLYRPLLNLLRHHNRRCLVVLSGTPDAAQQLAALDAVAAVAVKGVDAPGEELWRGTDDQFSGRVDATLVGWGEKLAVYAPEVPANAPPERVRALVERLRLRGAEP